MTSSLGYILAVSTALFVFAPAGCYGIRCWVCSSGIDHKCADPFNTTQNRYLVTDCDRDRSYTPYLRTTAVCRKIRQTVNGDSVIVRSCSWGTESDPDGPCSSKSLHPSTKLEYCSTCDKDECNGATTNVDKWSATSSVVLALAAMALAAVGGR